MAKYKPHDYNQLIMIPVSLEAQLTPGTLGNNIHMVVENESDNPFSQKIRLFKFRYFPTLN